MFLVSPMSKWKFPCIYFMWFFNPLMMILLNSNSMRIWRYFLQFYRLKWRCSDEVIGEAFHWDLSAHFPYTSYSKYCGPQYLWEHTVIIVFQNYGDRFHSKWMKISSNGWETVLMDENLLNWMKSPTAVMNLQYRMWRNQCTGSINANVSGSGECCIHVGRLGLGFVEEYWLKGCFARSQRCVGG